METHILPFSFLSLLQLPSHFIFLFSLAPSFIICMAAFLFEDKRVAVDNVHSASRSNDIRDPPPFPVMDYIKRYGDRLDGLRFSAMPPLCTTREIRHVQIRRMRDTAIGAWIKR